MPAILLCRTGDEAGLAHPITGERCVVGREEACDLSLLHPQLSRRHAELRAEGPELSLSDLGSSNGTFVNGQRLEEGEARALKHLDRLTFGEDLEFVLLELDRVPRTEVLAAHLVDVSGERVPLQLGENTVGSAEQADLILTDQTVSPVHLRLALSAGGLVLTVEPGAGPVRVNGEEVEHVRLADGDFVDLTPEAGFGIELFSGFAEAPPVDAGDATHPSVTAAEPSPGDRAVAEEATTTLERSEIQAALREAQARHQEAMAKRAHDRREARGQRTSGPGTSVYEFGAEEGATTSVRRTWSSKRPEPIHDAAPEQPLQAARREAAVRLLYRLEGGTEEQGILLREGRHLVGRHEGCRVVLPDPSVSREHAEVRVGPQGVVVKDLGSANGCWKGDERFEESSFADGETVKFGQVECRFEHI